MTKKLFIPILMFLFFALLSCEEELTPNEAASKILTGSSWKLQSTKIDGVSSNLYSGLQITFTESGYTTDNGGDIFGASGSWTFNVTNGKEITLGSGLNIQLESLASTGLTVSFFWDKTILNQGRTESLKGQHQMTFTGQ